MKVSKHELENIKLILNEEKEYSKVNEKQLVKALIFNKKYLLTESNNLFLNFDSLIELNNIILEKNNSSLHLCQVKPAGFEFEYMHFSKISLKLQILINKFNDRRVSKRDFVTEFLNIHPFLDRKGRTIKILTIC